MRLIFTDLLLNKILPTPSSGGYSDWFEYSRDAAKFKLQWRRQWAYAWRPFKSSKSLPWVCRRVKSSMEHGNGHGRRQ